MALVERQAAEIQQLKARLDESHQENQVLRQERDTLKNMLRASDTELTEVKKARTASSVSLASHSKSAHEDASVVDSLRSQISHLRLLLSSKKSSSISDEAHASSVAAEIDGSASASDSAKDGYHEQQQQLESSLQQSQKLQQEHAAALHAALHRISLLESDNAQVLSRAAASSSALAEAESLSKSLTTQSAKSQTHAALLDDAVSELRSKVCALQASLATYASIASTNVRVSSDSISVQTSDLSLSRWLSSFLDGRNRPHASFRRKRCQRLLDV